MTLGTGGPATLADAESGCEAANQEDVATRCEWLQGIVYIGKAIDLYARFGNQLCPSWNPPHPSIHTSKRNWDGESSSLKSDYPSERMQMTFMRMSAKDWTEADTLTGFLNVLEKEFPTAKAWFREKYAHWTETHGNCRANLNVAATITEEQSLLKKFRQCFDRYPVLNRDVPEESGPLDEEWLEALFAAGQDPDKVNKEADKAIRVTDDYERADPPMPSDSGRTDLPA